MPKVQAAARMVTEAAENNGPMIFARMGVMQAIHRQEVREFGALRANLTIRASGSARRTNDHTICRAMITKRCCR
jgi:hypothetical protein